MSGIDFVLTWVDGSDEEWQSVYKEYKGDRNINFAHYRDYGTLKFWFRSVEKYAPWVDRIHFVTCGQTPEWLNTEHPKLNLVNHSDYIPAEYLPTFSSNPIELNLHRIDGISERFVYFNDDTFVTAPSEERDFFRDGMPCDSAIFSSVIPSVKNEVITNIIFNDLLLLNCNFSKKQSLKKNFAKYFSLKYGRGFFRNLYYLPIGKFSGFVNPHLPNSFLKSTFDEVWESEPEILSMVSANRFRTGDDVNQYLMRYWQLAKGTFAPRPQGIGACFSLSDDMDMISDSLAKRKYKLMCINDDPNVSDADGLMLRFLQCMERAFPDKCSFEL